MLGMRIERSDLEEIHFVERVFVYLFAGATGSKIFRNSIFDDSIPLC